MSLVSTTQFGLEIVHREGQRYSLMLAMAAIGGRDFSQILADVTCGISRIVQLKDLTIGQRIGAKKLRS